MDNTVATLDPRQHAVPVPGDQVAIRLYRLLETRSELDLRHVFAAIERSGVALSLPVADEANGDLAGSGHASKRQLDAEESLKAATRALGAPPSRRKYDDWRSEQTDPDAYASATTIRRAFENSWDRARESLGGVRSDLTARRLLSNGRKFSIEECRRALQLFASATQDIPNARRWHHYATWARAYSRTPGAVRLPLSHRRIVRRLDTSWSELWARPEIWAARDGDTDTGNT